MKQFIILFLGVLFAVLPVSAAHAHDSDFFVRILSDREQVYAGDSMLVSVVLYAPHPITQAEAKDNFKVSGGKCGLRPLSINRNATAGRVREGQQVYYTLVWAQYVVSPSSTGKYKISSVKFDATLQQTVRMPDLFDQMMGARPEYKEISVSAKSDVFTFEVKEKPLRSTRDMMRTGTVL